MSRAPPSHLFNAVYGTKLVEKNIFPRSPSNPSFWLNHYLTNSRPRTLSGSTIARLVTVKEMAFKSGDWPVLRREILDSGAINDLLPGEEVE